MLPALGTRDGANFQHMEPTSNTLSRSTRTAPLFARTHYAALDPQTGGTLEVLACGDPTDNFGVGLLRFRLDAPAYFAHPPSDHHALVLHHSRRRRVITQTAGRRIEHEPLPRSITAYPNEMESTCETTGPGEYTLIRVSAECLVLAGSQLAAHGGTLVERTGESDDTIVQIGLTLEAEAAAGYPNGMLFWSSAADVLIHHLAAHHLSLQAASPRGAVSCQDLRKLDDYIHANLAGPLNLDSLAAVVGCDRFHFAHRFRAAVGVSPHRYVMRRRLDRARERIKAGAGSLAEIAAETGFTDQSHLSRWVRRIYNLRPSDLRPDAWAPAYLFGSFPAASNRSQCS